PPTRRWSASRPGWSGRAGRPKRPSPASRPGQMPRSFRERKAARSGAPAASLSPRGSPMSLNQTALALLLWGCLAAVVYAYVGSPVVVYCLARLVGRRRPDFAPADEDLPVLSLLIAAHNEEAVIDGRVQNALALDYPPDKLEIVVATDGCADRT